MLLFSHLCKSDFISKVVIKYDIIKVHIFQLLRDILGV